MMKTLLVAFVFISSAHAYTLNNNFGATFKNNKVKVSVDRSTTCANAGVTVYELEELIKPSVDKFWNTVPTSDLVLKSGGFQDTTTNINTGRLCAPTDDECITTAGSTVIPPVDDIIIACNNNALNFGDPNVIAVTIPNNFSGKKITGAVILINESSTIFSTLSTSDRIGVIAHEIGHAIGLGHTDDKGALMYYRTVDQRKKLGEDDMRGVSYLYPMQLDGGGLLGGCGTIDTGAGSINPPFWQMGAMLALMIAIIEAMKLFNRSKTRTPT
jgi:hypothetical protein